MKTLPRYNGAKRIGARPGNPVYFFLPVTSGSVSVKSLPDGISFDSRKNIVSGVIQTPGSYKLEFIAENENGAMSFSVELAIGEEIAYDVWGDSPHFAARAGSGEWDTL